MVTPALCKANKVGQKPERTISAGNRLVFLNRYFFPDQSASSQMLSDLAFHLAMIGREVHVITGKQLYDNPKVRLPAEETIKNVHVHRVATTHFGRSRLLGRSLDYLSFLASARRLADSLLRPNDIVIAKTDPPLLSVLAMRAAKNGGAHLVNWLQDIYPDVAIQLGVQLLKGPVGWIFCYWRNQSLNAASTNVVVGYRMKEKILSLGIPDDRIRVIHNWSDDQTIVPTGHAVNNLRYEWGLQDKFVIGYSGNLGRAHEYQTILAASIQLLNLPHIVFLFIGGGYRFDELKHTVRKLGIERSFRFVPYQPRANLANSLAVPDVHWISLRPELDGLIVPSKFYGIAAAGKPMISITARDGEIGRLVNRYNCGVVVEPGDFETLTYTIIRLSSDRNLLTLMGRRARKMLEAEFTREDSFRSWRRLFENIEKSRMAA